MFNETSAPHVFGLPPGVDFGRALVEGLIDRTTGQQPDALARVELYVNTRRMQRRIREIFDEGPARLLPKVRLVTDIGGMPEAADLPLPTPPLRRRLELAEMVSRLLESQPDLAPRSALFALSDSLASLLEEMHAEGVDPEILESLDISDVSGHWERSLRFMTIVRDFAEGALGPSAEARQRAAVIALAKRWSDAPPTHPVIVAGSTGSRGSTALFMEAVAKLPQGAIVLPGFDFDMPDSVWARMSSANGPEDHPQFRFVRLIDQLAMPRQKIARWSGPDATNPERNRLISLSLRPAPVTDQWREDAKSIGSLEAATAGITLITTPDQRTEAAVIALGIRSLVGAGRKVALVTPDRQLTRQVTAELERWELRADDSAGQPLHLSPPGRLLRQVAACFGTRPSSEALLALLKHPLVRGPGGRGAHLRLTHELELFIRRQGVAFPDAATVSDFTKNTSHGAWGTWLSGVLENLSGLPVSPVADHLNNHLSLAETLCQPDETGRSGIWEEAAGRKAQETMAHLAAHADACIDLNGPDYSALVYSLLSGEEVRNPDVGHPNALIWGTLEARVQSADVTILAGLNEGSWPEAPSPDPWLNRQMRKEAGLLLPERRIGLSAHDYQQAVCGPEVWLTRSDRSGDATSVPSRWLNRLQNLLSGLEDGGQAALNDMTARGKVWLDAVAALEEPERAEQPSPRPSPCPPVVDRPKKMSVTQVKTLIRNPYAIYARDVLGLRPLNSLTPQADAPLRGNILHKVMERWVKECADVLAPSALAQLLDISREEFTKQCPWPTICNLWISRFADIAPDIVQEEIARQSTSVQQEIEKTAQITISDVAMELTARADRIDIQNDGSAVLYDYKSGQIATGKQQLAFDKQLLVQAAMIEKGAFATVGAPVVSGAYFLGIGSKTKTEAAPLDKAPTSEVWSDFVGLLQLWRQPDRGYSARQWMTRVDDVSDYDHLSRYGEWDESSIAKPEPLT